MEELGYFQACPVEVDRDPPLGATQRYPVFLREMYEPAWSKAQPKRIESDSTRFMTMVAEIMLFFPPKAL